MIFIKFIIVVFLIIITTNIIRKYLRGNKLYITYIRLILCYAPILILFIEENMRNLFLNYNSQFELYLILSFIFGVLLSLFNFKEVKVLFNKDILYILPKMRLTEFITGFFGIILASFYEEILFRGYTYTLPLSNFWLLIISTTLFILFHYATKFSRNTMNIKKVLLLATLSIGLYVFLILSDNIIVPIIGHIGYNFITILFIIKRYKYSN